MRIMPGGNVGIGTVAPGSLLSIAGGVGIGTGLNSSYVSTAAPVGGMIVQGNVGIGSWSLVRRWTLPARCAVSVLRWVGQVLSVVMY